MGDGRRAAADPEAPAHRPRMEPAQIRIWKVLE